MNSENKEAAKVRRDFARAITSTQMAMLHLRKLEEEYGLDYSDDDSSIELLRKALRQQVEDLNYLVEFVETMEVDA